MNEIKEIDHLSGFLYDFGVSILFVRMFIIIAVHVNFQKLLKPIYGAL